MTVNSIFMRLTSPAGRPAFFRLLVIAAFIGFSAASCKDPSTANKSGGSNYYFPEGYLDQPDSIPAFWITTNEEIISFLKTKVRTGKVERIGTSAGGRPVMAVMYGSPRKGGGTTTFSGACGIGNIAPYRGQDNDKTVYLGLGGVHGFETEGIMGIVNLISVLEEGRDLNGKEWPEITSVLRNVDRIILIPLLNPDGRARVPVIMETHKGASRNSYLAHEYLNTGGKPDGSLIGWPDVKEFIPMDFSKVGFPGGYPNDAGVNLMHDDFFGKLQPENQALFDLAAREKPDIIINMHTGAPGNNYFMRMHRPVCEAALEPVYDSLSVMAHTVLALSGPQSTNDPDIEADPSKSPRGVYNLDCALNLHCGALSVVVEAPSHGFSGTDRSGKPVLQTPEMILNAELVVHLEAMKFLAGSGGRSRWKI